MFDYWHRWLRTTLGYAWTWAERVAGAIGLLGTLIVIALGRAGFHHVSEFLAHTPLYVLGLLAVYRLLMAPAILEREAKERHQRELAERDRAVEDIRREATSALAERDALRAKLNQRNVLGELLEELSAFASRPTDTSEEYEIWRAEYQAWVDHTKARITKELTRADVATFLAPSGTSRHFKLAFDPEHAAVLNAIADQIANLKRMIERRDI